MYIFMQKFFRYCEKVRMGIEGSLLLIGKLNFIKE